MADEEPPPAPDPALEAERQELLRKLGELRTILEGVQEATEGVRRRVEALQPTVWDELRAELVLFARVSLIPAALLLLRMLAVYGLGERSGLVFVLELLAGLILALALVRLFGCSSFFALLAPRASGWHQEVLLAAIAAATPAVIGSVLLVAHPGLRAKVLDRVPDVFLVSPRVAAGLTLYLVLWLLALGARLCQPVSAPAPAPPGSP